MNQIQNFEFIGCRRRHRLCPTFPFSLLSFLIAWVIFVAASSVCSAQSLQSDFPPSFQNGFTQQLAAQDKWIAPQHSHGQHTQLTQLDQQFDMPNPDACADGCQIGSLDAQAAQPAGRFQSAKNWLGAGINKVLGSPAQAGTGPDFKRIFGALAIVLGSYFALVWFLRMLSPASNTHLPRDVIQVLGKTPFGNRQHLQLVRLGTKLLLLLETPDGIQPIAEVSDPREAEHLANLCDPKSKRRQGRVPTPPNPAQTNSQAYSFRIPAMENPSSISRSSLEPDNPRLSDVVRIIENAHRQESRAHRTSYEA